MASAPSARRRPLVAVFVIGLGLVVAPVVFQMFTRAPKGGHMIDRFRPYMTTTKIGTFQGYLDEIDRARIEARDRLPAELAARLRLDPAAADRRFAAVADFERRWPGIDADMSDMLTTMRREAPSMRAALSSVGSTCLMPASVLMKIGNTAA